MYYAYKAIQLVIYSFIFIYLFFIIIYLFLNNFYFFVNLGLIAAPLTWKNAFEQSRSYGSKSFGYLDKCGTCQ